MAEEERKKLSLLSDDLASLENYIHDLFSFSPLPICFVSPIGVVLEANPSFETLSQLRSYELIGEPIERVFKKEEVESLTRETLAKGFVRGKRMTFLPQGKTEMTVQAFTQIRKDEKDHVVGYFLSLFDITKIEETEEELTKAQVALMNMLEDTEDARRRVEEEKNRTQAIITNLTDGLFFFDQDNKISLTNPQAENFFAVKTEQIIGKPISAFSKIPSLKPLLDLLGEEVKGVFRKELPLKEGGLTLEITTIPITVEKEKMGTLIILHDVTREKMVERMKTEFVSIAAHQLRTPLSAIKWTLRMLLDGDLGEITPEQREFIEKTYQSNARTLTLINDLLNVTRIEEGRYLFKPVLSDIKMVLDSVIDFYKEITEKKNITLQFKKPKRGTGNIFWFEFNNNKRFNQHNILHVTADATQPHPTVFYALPAYTNIASFEHDSPDFLNNTYFIDVFDTPLIFDQRAHQFEIDIQNLTFQIHSKSKLGKGKIFKWNTIKEKFSSEKIGIDATIFKNKVLEFGKGLPANVSMHEDDRMTAPIISKVFLKSLVL